MSIDSAQSFIYTYKLLWPILALLTWLLIIFTCSFRQFLHALPIGIWTMIIGGVLENFFIVFKFWQENLISIPVGELDLFVVIGPFFTIGVIFVRFLPSNPWGKVFLILLLSVLATGIELIAIELGMLKYTETRWIELYSIAAYTIGLMSAQGFYYIYYNLPKKH